MEKYWPKYKPEGRTSGKASEAGDRMAAGLKDLVRRQDRQSVRLNLRQEDLDEATDEFNNTKEEHERVFSQAAERVAFHEAQILKKQATESNTDELAALFEKLKEKHKEALQKNERLRQGFDLVKTQRDQAREALKESEEAYRTAVAASNAYISVDQRRCGANMESLVRSVAKTTRRMNRGAFFFLAPDHLAGVEEFEDFPAAVQTPDLPGLVAKAYKGDVETKKKLGKALEEIEKTKRRETSNQQMCQLVVGFASGSSRRRLDLTQVPVPSTTVAPPYFSSITELEAPTTSSLGSVSVAKTVKTLLNTANDTNRKLRLKNKRLGDGAELLCTMAASGQLRCRSKFQRSFRAPVSSSGLEHVIEDLDFEEPTSSYLEDLVVALDGKLDREMSQRQLLGSLVHSGHSSQPRKTLRKKFPDLPGLQPPQFDPMDDGLDENTLPEMHDNDSLLLEAVDCMNRKATDSSVRIGNVSEQAGIWQGRCELAVWELQNRKGSIRQIVQPLAGINAVKLSLRERKRDKIDIINMPFVSPLKDWSTILDETVAGWEKVEGLEAALRSQKGLAEALHSTSVELVKSGRERAELEVARFRSIGKKLSGKTKDCDEIVDLDDLDIPSTSTSLIETVSSAGDMLQKANAQLGIAQDGLCRNAGMRKIDTTRISAEITRPSAADETNEIVEFDHPECVDLGPLRSQALDNLVRGNAQLATLREGLSKYSGRFKSNLGQWDAATPRCSIVEISDDVDEMDYTQSTDLSGSIDAAVTKSAMQISKVNILDQSLPHGARSTVDVERQFACGPKPVPVTGDSESEDGVIELDLVNGADLGSLVDEALAKSATINSMATILHESQPLSVRSKVEAKKLSVSTSKPIPGMSADDAVDFEQYHPTDLTSTLSGAVEYSDTLRKTTTSKLAVAQHELKAYRPKPKIDSQRLKLAIPKRASTANVTEFGLFESTSLDSVLLHAISAASDNLDGTQRKLKLVQELVEGSSVHSAINPQHLAAVARAPPAKEYQEEEIDDFEPLGLSDLVTTLLDNLPAQAKNLRDASANVSLLTHLVQDSAPRQTLFLAGHTAKAITALQSTRKKQSTSDQVDTEFQQSSSSLAIEIGTGIATLSRRSKEGEIAREICSDLHRARSQREQDARSSLADNQRRAEELLKQRAPAPQHEVIEIAYDLDSTTDLVGTKRGVKQLKKERDEAVAAVDDLLGKLERRQNVSRELLAVAQQAMALSEQDNSRGSQS